jgi:ABC-type dipeptide/oligopeptide/nickel transport system permease subunit
MSDEIVAQIEVKKEYKTEIESFYSVEGLKDIKLVSYSLFIIWPMIAVMALILVLITIIKTLIKKKSFKESSLKHYFSLIIMPYYLIRLSVKQKEIKTLVALLLLLPFMIGTIISPIMLINGHNDEIINSNGMPKPPAFFHLFQGTGEGLFGTNGQGEGIAQLIFIGTGQIYLLTFITVLFIIVLGLWLGKNTYRRKAEFYIMGFAEILESIPVFFLLLVVLSIFGWWEAYIKGSESLFRFFFNASFIITISLLMGLSFIPRLIRIISERIKAFNSENFIDTTKALGISQNKILWYHIIRKNCLEEILLFISQIWASIILLEISMDYLVSIFPVLGARIYSGWAQMLLSSETVRAILFIKELSFQNWWLYFFPVFFIVTIITGFNMYGDSLRKISEKPEIDMDIINKIPYHSLIYKFITRK